MKKETYIRILLLGILMLVLNSFYIINEKEQAIITQFGKPVGDAKIDSGLEFKLPFIQTVIKFDKRILEWDGSANEIPTKDNKYIFIDTFARWKISNPLQFYKSARNEMLAQSRLDDIIDGAVEMKFQIGLCQKLLDQLIGKWVFMIQKLMEDRRGLERRCKNIDY